MSTRIQVHRYMFNARTLAFSPEIDTLRSIYPPLVTSGYNAWGASTDKTSLVVVPSGTRYILRELAINNRGGGVNEIQLYDGPGTSVTVFGFNINQSVTEWITGLTWIFQSAVHAQPATSTIQVRVAGILLPTGPGE